MDKFTIISISVRLRNLKQYSDWFISFKLRHRVIRRRSNSSSHEKSGLKTRCRKKSMKNSADVILVLSRLAGKIRSIDCQVIIGLEHKGSNIIGTENKE